jgi:hypothetical protein
MKPHRTKTSIPNSQSPIQPSIEKPSEYRYGSINHPYLEEALIVDGKGIKVDKRTSTP